VIPILPEEASTIAGRVDALAWALIALSAVGFVLVATLLVAFSIRFRARRERGPTNVADANLERSPHGVALEIGWSVLPFLLFLGFFAWGAVLFVTMRRPPDDSLQVFAVGKRWMWKLQHLEGKREINSLHVPVGQPVRVTLTSEDVIHSFFVPAFRVKQDAVPGRYTDLWFEATRPGRYHLFCTEYCGSQHSRMIGEVVALEPAAYQAWLAGEAGGAVSMADAGRDLFAQLGCPTCHAAAPDARGPALAGLFGKTVRLADGAETVVDESYVRRAILDPAGQLVAGYQPIMPTYKGLVTEEGLLQLIAYIKSLSAEAGKGASDAPRDRADAASGAAAGEAG
jgi:cytochrome c oxidase subunit II